MHTMSTYNASVNVISQYNEEKEKADTEARKTKMLKALEDKMQVLMLDTSLLIIHKYLCSSHCIIIF